MKVNHPLDGYRRNVGIILFNHKSKVFWARRSGHDGWQFPQGGVKSNESPEDALYRELQEEVGLEPSHVKIVARTQDWLHYDLPQWYRRRLRKNNSRNFRGQKQIWFLLEFTSDESKVCLDSCEKPEFDQWVWKEWEDAVEEIIDFKRKVYRTAFSELKVYLPSSTFF